MYNQDIRFILERYKAGGSNRYVCPQCGRKRSFTRYIDLETGEYVAEECGKCNHTASCGYHYPPREYFRDHPERNAPPDYINGKPLLGLAPRSSPRSLSSSGKGGSSPGSLSQRVSYSVKGGSSQQLSGRLMIGQEVEQTEFFDIAWAEKSMGRTSTFRHWLEQLSIDGTQQPSQESTLQPSQDSFLRTSQKSSLHLALDGDSIQRVLADYYVGGTRRDVVVRGVNYGPAVVFWLIDEQGRVHDAKLMAYRGDGHRVADWGNSMRAICERNHIGPQLAETEKVLFGLHLLPCYPDKTVCIVESEKTAIICACRYPQFVWLATGGCGNLQKSKLQPLRDRMVVVYPDSGEFEKWKECMAGSGVAHYKVVDFMEQYEPNTDIADILLGEARQKPKILLPPPTEVCPF